MPRPDKRDGKGILVKMDAKISYAIFYATCVIIARNDIKLIWNEEEY